MENSLQFVRQAKLVDRGAPHQPPRIAPLSHYQVLVGIDPGVTTGFAVWLTAEKRFTTVTSCQRVQVEANILQLAKDNLVLVRFEDARLRQWFGKSGAEKLQGAGAIKRDSQLWQEFCQHYRIAFQAVAPRHNKTKLPGHNFKTLTCWPHRCDQHARDAAMLVFGG